MLRKRILTAVIALPVVFALLLYIPKALIFFVFLILALGSTYETAGILIPALRSRLGDPIKGPGTFWVILCTLVSGLVFSFLALRVQGAELGVGVFCIMLLLLISNFFASSIDGAVANMLGTLFSVIYGGLPWISLLDLYEMGDHSRFLFLLLGIVMANDSGAFFAGKYFGRHQLAPKSSPKKTWEGAIGGLIGGVLGAFVIDGVFWGQLGTWTFLIVLAIITGIAGILGDLMESVLKRFGGVKDSGSIFPGHGGLLDRTDSIVVAAPVMWFVLFITKLDFPFF